MQRRETKVFIHPSNKIGFSLFDVCGGFDKKGSVICLFKDRIGLFSHAIIFYLLTKCYDVDVNVF